MADHAADRHAIVIVAIEGYVTEDADRNVAHLLRRRTNCPKNHLAVHGRSRHHRERLHELNGSDLA